MVHWIMCLILLAFKGHPGYKLIVAANRDEYYDRPTLPAAWWPDAPMLLGGKDLKQGGTWLGITRSGRLAAITNFRQGISAMESAPSRGRLVGDYLLGTDSPMAYLEKLKPVADRYNGFNLILGDADHLWYFSNRGAEVIKLQPGLYGLSNGLLDTPWPKVVKGKTRLREAIHNESPVTAQAIFSLLRDEEAAADEALPDTGVGIEVERVLSPLFIKTPEYGTRSSTVVMIDYENRVYFEEQSVVPPARNHYRFVLPST